MATTIHHRACHLCEAICGVLIETDGDTIVSIKGDPDDPLSRGHICPKAVALRDLHDDPDRLRTPLRRVRGRAGEYHHEPVDWDTALDAAAEAMSACVRDHGVNALAVYMGNPSVHNYGMLMGASALFKHLRTDNRYSATSVDQLPHHLVALWLFGHKLLFPIPDIDRTDFFLMLGANPVASNGSIWTVPGVRDRIKALTRRGGQLVVVDPRRTETAELASQHHFIRPGSDAWLLLAMIHVLFRDELVAVGRLDAHVDGRDTARAAVASFTPDAASIQTGIDADTITGLAHAFAGAERAVCYGRMGVSTQAFGTVCQWAIQVLNVLTGNFDREGGVLFTRPAVDQISLTGPGGFGRHRSRVRGLPEFDRELPVAALAEEITTPGEGQVRVLFTGAGNPVLSTPAGHTLDAALESLDFMVSLDFYLNETTRHADIILPPTSPLEHDHYDLVFHHMAVRNTARFSDPVFERSDGALHDWEIFAALGARVAALLGGDPAPAVPPETMIDLALKAGPWGEGSAVGLSLAALRASPSGVDLGPLEPQCPERLQTRDKRINLAVPEVLADLDRLRAETTLAAEGYRLIGRRHVRDNNSWMHNAQRLVKGKARSQLLIHPDDAAREHLADGDRVRLVGAAGAVEVVVAVSDTVMPGVLSLPHGYGHGRDGTRARIANAVAGVSCNDVTDSGYLDALCGNAAVNGVPVRLESLAGTAGA